MNNSFRPLVPLFLAALMLSVGPVASVRAEDQSGDIQQMMSSKEFKDAGLDKLSPEELQHLNDWLHGFRESTEKAVEAKANKEGRRKTNLIVSRVVGPFDGLTGNTIIKLEDGTVWRQANKSDRYKGPGLESLGVAVTKAGLFGWKMRIQGTQEFYVDQITK